MHGATPWRGEAERRIALYRFAPANMGYGRGYLEIPQEDLEQMAPQANLPLSTCLIGCRLGRHHAQVRAVLEPPYSTRLERPILTEETVKDPSGPASVPRRNEAKKALDRKLFGTEYF